MKYFSYLLKLIGKSIYFVVSILCVLFTIFSFVMIFKMQIKFNIIDILQLSFFLITIIGFTIATWGLPLLKINNKRKLSIFCILFILLLINLKLPAINNILNVDICLDGGGKWNAKKNICEYD